MIPTAADPVAPRCPGCAEEMGEAAPHCGHCGFTGEHTLALYGNSFPPLKEVGDAAECWSLRQITSIRHAQRDLRRKFPQIRTYVESVSLPVGASAATYGFWRLNTAPMGTHESALHRSWSVLLVLDAASGIASVSCGYRVERWIDGATWVEMLAPMAPAWERGRRGVAVCEWYGRLAKVLDRVRKEKGAAGR